MPPRWQHQSFPETVPLTRRPVTTIHRQDTTVKVPELGGWGWSTESEKDHIQRKEEQLHSDCIIPNPGCTTLHQRGSLWACGFSSDKNRAQVDIHLSQHHRRLPGRPIPVLPHGNHWGNLQRFNQLQIEVEKGAGLTATSTQISLWVDPIPACSNAGAEKPQPGVLPIYNPVKHFRNLIIDRCCVLQLGLTISYSWL